MLKKFCTPFNGPMRWVGDVASDAKCTDNDIQSAINAIAANPSSCPATIFITREHTYTAQHLTISNTGKSIKLEGQGDGVSCGTGESICIQGAVCPVVPVVTLSGSGHTGDSVIHIDGTNYVTLKFLTVSQGTLDSDQGGGGIYFNGNGSLTLDRSVVSFNTAGYGGGIDFIGSGGDATLSLLANTSVLSNTALVDGGGVRTEGTARFFALQDQTLIAFNHADNGHGGGLDVIAPSRADVGSSGFSSLGVIYDNQATYGGGVSINDGGHNTGDATVRLFTTNAAKPVRISGNFASMAGGGIYLKPGAGTFAFDGAYTCLSNFILDDNRAAKGGAIYANFDSGTFVDVGSGVSVNSEDQCGPESTVALGATACAPGVECNLFLGNTSTSTNIVTGGVVEISQSFFSADHFSFLGNTGNTGILLIGSNSPVTLSTCLIAGNQTQAELISNHGADSLNIDGCTIADNSIVNGSVVFTSADTTLTRTIIDQPGSTPFDRPSGTLTSQYVLSNDISGLGAGTVMQGEPQFVNAAAGDYHLADDSLGLDFAPAAGGTDLDFMPRDVELIQVDDIYGPRDIGAYERQSSFLCGAADTIFCNGFEP